MLKAVLVNERKNMNMMIREMVSWNALDIAVVATAETGEEALEKIVREAPDVVVMSARIKGLSGPEVVRAAREYGVSPEYIIIAGPRSFEAVYAALQCGVSDYLVGALDLKKLTDALRKVSIRRSQTERSEQNAARERRIFEMNRDIIRRHFISNVLSGASDSVNTINRVNGEFLFDFRPGTYEVAVLCPDFSEGNQVTTTELEDLLDEIGAVASRQFAGHCQEHVWFRRRSVDVCVLNYVGDIHTCFEQLYEQLRELTASRGGTITLALGTRETELRSIRTSFDAAMRALSYRLTLGTDRIIPYGLLQFNSVPVEEVFTGGIERRLRMSIVAFNGTELRAAITDLFTAVDAIEDVDPYLYWEVSNRIAELILESLKDKNILVGSAESMFSDFRRMLLLASTPSQVCAAVKVWAVTLIERVIYDEDSKESRAVRVAKAFIKDHYVEQVKLDDLSRVTGLNASYLSTLFKKETGQNFSEFLIECRLNEAKKLLRETTLTINEITEHIGYGDSKYFSKLFVKNIGLTPSEYRRIYA